MWFDSLPALRPWISDFYLALAKPTATLLSLSRIQFQEAISRASDNFVMASHAELSGLRQGLRRITVAGKEVRSPQEAVEFPTFGVTSWFGLSTLATGMSKHQEDFRNTLEAWNLTIRRAPLQSSMLDTRLQEGSAAADACAQGSLWGIGEWCSAETQSVTPGSCWWFQLEGSIADLPQSWLAGNEAQPFFSCFELLALLALLVCRLRSPLPVSGRISLRRGSDNVTAGAAIMKDFTTSHPLRRFVQIVVRWATTSRVKLEVATSQESTTSGPTHSAATRNPPRISSRRNSASNSLWMSCSDQGINRDASPSTTKVPDQLRRLESGCAQTLVPHGCLCFSIDLPSAKEFGRPLRLALPCAQLGPLAGSLA